MNQVILMGRLTKAPEVRYTQINNTKMVTFTLAVNRRNVEETDFINIIAFGKTAEFAEKYFTKGQQIALTGRLQIRNYEKDGKKIYVTEVVVNEFYFADSKKPTEGIAEDNYDDDLPF